MTGETWTILAMGEGVFALRLGGLALPAHVLPAGWARVIGFVPIAVLSALVATSLTGPAGSGATGAIAAAGAAAVALRTGRTWAALAAGMALWWAMALLG